jgi:hypothetical protein
MRSDDMMVEAPPHYVQGRRYEPDYVISDWKLNHRLGSVVGYIARAGRKDDRLQDLKKAQFYLDREIKRLEDEVAHRQVDESEHR